jgi:hypothetical protein
MILDLIDATATAVFTKLRATPAVTNLSQVTEHVLQNMLDGGAVTRIGKVESSPAGGKGGQQFEAVSVTIETLYRGTSPAACRAIMFQQRLALEHQALSLAGVEFDTPEWEGGVVDGPASDGVTYVGVQTFSIFAQPEG